MFTTIIFEYYRDFTVFDITPANLTGVDQARVELVLNSVVLIQGTDYDPPIIPAGDVVIIRNVIPLLDVTDTLVINIYDASLTTIQDTYNVIIRPRLSYVEVSGAVSNGILPTDTNDPSAILITPLDIEFCQIPNINGHYLSRIQIGTPLNGTASAILINGIPIVDSDVAIINNPIVPALNFDVFGVVTTIGPFVEFVTIPYNTAPLDIELTANGTGNGVDQFTIDGIGFTQVEAIGATVEVLIPTGNYLTPRPTSTSTYRVELTTLAYNLYIDNVLIDSYPRQVIYSSNVGVLTPSGLVPLFTSAVFNPTVLGPGYIEANFGVTVSRQLVNIVPTPQPILLNGNTFNVCTGGLFNLNALPAINTPVGSTLQWFNDTALTLPVLTPSSVPAGVYYVVFNNGAGCLSAYETVTISTIACNPPVDDTFIIYSPSSLTNSVAGNDNVNCPGAVSFVPLLGTLIGGTIASFVTPTGGFTFIPTPGFFGIASFDYEEYCDEGGGPTLVGTATVTIYVNGAILQNDTYVTMINTSVSGNVSTNDSITCLP